jgi:hypothetical protein
MTPSAAKRLRSDHLVDQSLHEQADHKNLWIADLAAAKCGGITTPDRVSSVVEQH